MRTSLLLVSSITAAVAVAFACGGSTDSPAPPNTTLTDLPCDVAAVISKCTSCHSSPPSGGAPMALLSGADLQAPSASDPSKTYAQVSVERMTAGTMPPGGGAAADAPILDAWIKGGYVAGSCTADGGTTEFPGPALCTSGKGSTRNGTTMRPGEACIACHATKFGAPTFWVAGTLYPTGREQTDCKGVPAGATVRITDANSVVYNLPVNSAGNFFLDDFNTPNFKAPYAAEVIVGNDSRKMLAAQTDGDCNGCHSEPPKNGAPGRIVVPAWNP